MLKKMFLATAAGICMAGAASAADLPRKSVAPAYVVPQLFSWTGFYAGLNAGYGFGGENRITTAGQSATNIANVAGGARPFRTSLDRDGFTGGGQIGYNVQIGSFVLGAEADIAYTDFGRRKTVGTLSLAGAPLSNTFRNEQSYLGTVRGRIGYAFDRWMVYGTGGLAYGDVENRADFFGPGPANLLQFTGRSSDTRVGYAIGGGAEYAFTNNLTVKAEYLYYDLGRQNVNVALVPGSGGAPTGYFSRFENDGQIVRAGVNYKFSGPLF